MKWLFASILAMSATLGQAFIFVNQTPASNGGTMRWSKLWIDPSGLGNDLDSDAICYEDFVLGTDAQLEHVEWWGNLNPNLGFQIEFWRQDPGTVAYQPLAVFREVGAQPEAAFVTTDYVVTPDAVGGGFHFSWDIPTPVSLAANSTSNPRWFIAVIGLTSDAPTIWTWSQGLGGSNRTFQWIRGDGNRFWVLSEGRALLLSGTPVPEPAGLIALGLAAVVLIRKRMR